MKTSDIYINPYNMYVYIHIYIVNMYNIDIYGAAILTKLISYFSIYYQMYTREEAILIEYNLLGGLEEEVCPSSLGQSISY